ncbi:MAG: Asp23/Gls24 family envelope stress response protein [Bacillota bacterium]
MSEQLKEQIREDKIRISEEVVAAIAGIAASEDENVASMSTGFIDGIAGMIGKKTPGRGIKVEMKEDQANIDIAVIIRYGCKIHEVARNMQARVRKAVEDMTGLKVVSVNVNVLGVNLSKEAGKLEIADEVPPQVQA